MRILLNNVLKILLTISFFILSWNYSFCQKSKSTANESSDFSGSNLERIGNSLMRGDKSAIIKIAPYFDSNKEINGFSGNDMPAVPESHIAKTLIAENCIFLNSEIEINKATTSKTFLAFYKRNENKISFSTDAGAFLITPLKNRQVRYEIRELSTARKHELKEGFKSLLTLKWVKKNNIDKLIKSKNPIGLFKIASELYKSQHGLGDYFDAKSYVDLLDFLTGTEIGVENDLHKITFLTDRNYEQATKLNLLIYFAKNYQLYSWNDTLGLFDNPRIKIERLDKETQYFQLLSSKTNSVAVNAFVKLTKCNVERVQTLADEYKKAGVDENDKLPTFPYEFLKQMVVLTAYCNSNHIDFEGSPQLIKNITRLKMELPFGERHKLEDEMINKMSLNDITAFEYWAEVNERSSFNLTYSAGRILDIFYSKNWNKIIANKKYLDLYLKKCKLYNDLGIIGICNNYLHKFAGSNLNTLQILKKNISTDNDIKIENAKAVAIASKKVPANIIKRYNDANYETSATNFEKDIVKLMILKIDSSERDAKISTVLSKINYHQIGIALKLIERYKFKIAYQKYNFMESDFGFFMCDFSKAESLKEFVRYYNSHSEKELYAHYLAEAGIDYLNTDESLNYDKIYELIKYDVVTAFVGGGGGTRDNEVYSLIKLLELKFKTTLGFPAKLCNSDNVYGCDSADRVVEWVNYLHDKGLLKSLHNEPVSFNYF